MVVVETAVTDRRINIKKAVNTYSLTEREGEFISEVVKSYTNGEIADELCIS